MKTLVIGDLHGNLEVVKKAIAQKTTDKVVFVGDYLDSYNRSVSDQVWTLAAVLNAVEEDPDRVTGLIGNHELSYIEDGQICSGWNQETDIVVNHMKHRVFDLLKTHTYVDGILVTHAGVNQDLLTELDMTLQEYLDSDDQIQVGKCRGGLDKFGGLFWNDFNMEFEPIPDVKQIFGHTHYRFDKEKGLKFKGDATNMSFNIDILPQFNILNEKLGDEAFGVIVEDGDVKEVNIFEL